MNRTSHFIQLFTDFVKLNRQNGLYHSPITITAANGIGQVPLPASAMVPPWEFFPSDI
jgi:hypothetical protein